MKTWLQKHRIFLSLLPVLAVMVMIFCFSAQPGEDSGALSGGIVAFLARFLVPDLETMSPDRQESILNTLGFVIRKAAHFSEYALLGLTLLFHIFQWQTKVSVKHPWLWAWAVGTLYAVSDEIHQYFVPGRGPGIRDVCIDSAGAAAGVGLLWLILQIHTCKIQKRKL